MRRVLRVLGILLAAIICVILIGCYTVKRCVDEELTRYKLSTKIEVLTEFSKPEFLSGAQRIKTAPLPDIDFDTIDYDQYEEVLNKIQDDEKSAKVDAESALADFITKIKANHFVANQVAKIDSVYIPVDNLENALLYIDREKALILSQNKLSALEQQTKYIAQSSQSAYWQALDRYVQIAFRVNDIEKEAAQRLEKHETFVKQQAAEEAESLGKEQTWAGVPSGAAGRLRIPQYDISIPLYASQSQSTVDAFDSAAYFPFNGIMVIGDHWNQNGFSAIRNMPAGTRVYIDNPDGTTSQYTVTWSGSGTNTSTQLLFPDGSVVDGRYGSLVLYTCKSNWQDVALVCCG